MLRAVAALCTYEGTGNTHIDFMLTIRALEEAGIPASAVVHEYGGPDGTDASLVDFVPEAIALASSGGIDRRVAPARRSTGDRWQRISPTAARRRAASWICRSRSYTRARSR